MNNKIKQYAIVEDGKVLQFFFEGDKPITESDIFFNECEKREQEKAVDDHGCYLYKAPEGEIIPTTDEEKAETIRMQKYNEIDSLYKSHIYAEYPIEKQNKYGFYFSSLLDKRLNGEELTKEEIGKAEELRALHRWYTQQLENCNNLQTSLNEMSYKDLINYVPRIVE